MIEDREGSGRSVPAKWRNTWLDRTGDEVLADTLLSFIDHYDV